MEEKEESNQQRSKTQKERKYDKQLFLSTSSSYSFSRLFLFFVALVCLVCSDCRAICVRTSSSCSLLLYSAMCMCPFTAAALWHIYRHSYIEHNEKEKRRKSERATKKFALSLSLHHHHHHIFFLPIHLSFALVDNDAGAAHHTAVRRGHRICVYTQRAILYKPKQ